MTTEACYLCGKQVEETYNTGGQDASWYKCAKCGVVKLSRTLACSKLTKEAKHILSGVARRRTDFGLDPLDFHTGNYATIVRDAQVPVTVAAKLDELLLYLQHRSKYPGQPVILTDSNDYVVVFAENEQELEFLVRQLEAMGLIEIQTSMQNGFVVVLSVGGWNRIVELERGSKKTNRVFIAMWFSKETECAYEQGVAPALRQCGFEPIRVDKLEHNEKICDRIVAEIRRSAFVVADFTGHRGGVYFEAGFAMGLGLPVIWLCRHDQVEQAHFDTRQYNHIAWENESDLCSRLVDRIQATIL